LALLLLTLVVVFLAAATVAAGAAGDDGDDAGDACPRPPAQRICDASMSGKTRPSWCVHTNPFAARRKLAAGITFLADECEGASECALVPAVDMSGDALHCSGDGIAGSVDNALCVGVTAVTSHDLNLTFEVARMTVCIPVKPPLPCVYEMRYHARTRCRVWTRRRRRRRNATHPNRMSQTTMRQMKRDA
jgi:hypothetical protein